MAAKEIRLFIGHHDMDKDFQMSLLPSAIQHKGQPFETWSRTEEFFNKEQGK